MWNKNAKVRQPAVGTNAYFCFHRNPADMDIAHNLRQIRSALPPHVSLVAVSKTQPAEALMEAYHAGQRDFGENRVRELVMKQPRLPSDIAWHFIGHLQTNKVRYIAPFVSLIHSIDGLKLLKEVNSEARKRDRVIDCLLQFHIASEETKFGMDLPEAMMLLESDDYRAMDHVRITGVMGMASFTDDMDMVSGEFRMLRSFFNQIRQQYFSDIDTYRILSMGMSGDCREAVREGSNMVRIGSLIFGERTEGK